MPTFSDSDSLTGVLKYWLDNEAERKERAAAMQKVIRENHTYAHRAGTVLRALAETPPVRIAIKCAAVHKHREEWGDYHFAQGLAAALRRSGYVVRVDCRDNWYGGICDSDDLVIVLRGLVAYQPKPHQRNLLWMISHPDKTTVQEIEGYDHTFVASAYHADILNRLVPGRIEFMPQCTDVGRFYFDESEIGTRPNSNLYVANSRGVFRDPVRWAMGHELDLDIYGAGWEPFIEDCRLKGGVISNSVLGGVYASSRLVICDHWDYMREMGYVSNRVFGVLASGGRLVVDAVRGLEDLVPRKFYDRFRNETEFVKILRGPDAMNIRRRRAAAEWVARHHSFDARAASGFPDDRFLFMKFDDLVEDPKAFVRQATDFLGIDPMNSVPAGQINAGLPLSFDGESLTVRNTGDLPSADLPRFTMRELSDLQDTFNYDLKRTELLTGLDLKSWYNLPEFAD